VAVINVGRWNWRSPEDALHHVPLRPSSAKHPRSAAS